MKAPVFCVARKHRHFAPGKTKTEQVLPAPSALFLDNVNVKLVERNGYSSRIERSPDILHRLEIHAPVIRTLAPRTHRDVYRACGVLQHAHRRRRVLEHQLVAPEHLVDDLLSLREIVLVAYREHHVHTAYPVAVVVRDGRARHLPVGDEYRLVGIGIQPGVQYRYLPYRAAYSGNGNVVAYLERLVYHQHDATRNVRKAVLQRETYRNSRRADNGNDGCRGYSQRAEYHCYQQHVQHDLAALFRKIRNGEVKARSVKPLAYELQHQLADDKSDYQHDYRKDYGRNCANYRVPHVLEEISQLVDRFLRVLHEVVYCVVYRLLVRADFCGSRSGRY